MSPLNATGLTETRLRLLEDGREDVEDDFNMQKVCAKMVPKILTIEQKEARENVCTDTLSAIENDPNFLERVIT